MLRSDFDAEHAGSDGLAATLTATTGVPLAPLQPLESRMPVAMAVPVATVPIGDRYTAPQPWEVTQFA